MNKLPVMSSTWVAPEETMIYLLEKSLFLNWHMLISEELALLEKIINLLVMLI